MRGEGGRAGRRAAGGALKWKTFEKELEAGQLRPLYLLEGAEPVLRRETLAAIEKAAFAGDDASAIFGRQRFDGAEARAADIVSAAAGLPMFSRRCLVIVDRVDRLRKEDREALLPGLAAAPTTTVVVLMAATLDGRLTFTRELRARAAVVAVDGLPPAEMPGWVHERFSKAGHEVEPEAAEQILLLGGPSLSALAGEIEKVSLYVGAGAPVRLEDVNRVVAGGLGATLDDLVSAVIERDLTPALKALGAVLEAGEEPLRVLGFLNYRLTELWRHAQGSGGWYREEVKRAARRWTVTELARAIGALYAADRLLKGGGGEGAIPLPRARGGDRLVLEALLQHVVAGSGPEPGRRREGGATRPPAARAPGATRGTAGRGRRRAVE